MSMVKDIFCSELSCDCVVDEIIVSLIELASGKSSEIRNIWLENENVISIKD